MKFILREGFKKLNYYKKLTFATFLTSIISYFVLGIFLIISTSLVNSFNLFQQNEIKVITFVKSTATNEEVEQVKTELKGLKGSTKVEFISKEEGLESLKTDFKDDEVINNIKDDNPLPHTFITGFKSTSDANKAYNKLKNNRLIENINYEKDYLNEVSKTMNNIKITLTAIVIGMILSSVFFIIIVINLSIHNQKQNIRVMSLTGAPTKYIRGPFVVQGLIISITSSIISCILTLYLYNEYIAVFKKLFPFITTVNDSFVYRFVPIVIISMGIILGTLGSSIASRIEIRKMFKSSR